MDYKLFYEEQYRESFMTLREKYGLKELEDHSLLTTLGDLKEKTVLDFGCGIGYYTRMLSKVAKHVTGIDICEPMIKLAEMKTRSENITNVSYYVRDGLKELELGQFDVVVVTYVLSYAENLAMLNSFVKSICDSLKHNSYCVGITNNPNLTKDQLKALLKYGIDLKYPEIRENGYKGNAKFYDNNNTLIMEINDAYIEAQDFEHAFRNNGYNEFEWIKPSLPINHPRYEHFSDAIKHPYSFIFKAKKS